MNFKLLHGDSLDQLKKIKDNQIDAVVTDPPYGLSFMGKKWDYDVPQVELWKEVFRVLKPGGHLLSFAGTRTYHRMAVNIEDAGFEIRDMISWLYGSGFPKSLNIGKQVDKIQGNEREVVGKTSVCGTFKQEYQVAQGYRPENNSNGYKGEREGANVTKGNSQWEGYGTALKPACEPIVVARKPLSEKNIALNVLKHGTGGINIDGCRVGSETLGGGTMPNLRDVGAMSKEAMGIDKLSFGQNPRPAERKEQPTYQGRFPANIILDEEAGKILDEQSGISKSIQSQRGKSGIWNQGKGEDLIGRGHNDKGGASRFFYCAKASKSERNFGLDDFEEKEGIRTNAPRENEDIKTPERKNNHPTVKPIKLMQYLVRLVTPKGAICLDPFMGSGTTGIACQKEEVQFVGIEREEEYLKIAQARIEATLSKQAHDEIQREYAQAAEEEATTQ